MIMDNRFLTSRRTFDADATRYINAVQLADGQALEPEVAMAVDAFVRGCKADGIWDAIRASCILCGARTLNGALVPLVGTAPTSYNFASSDYNRITGLKGDGSTTYLDSGRANNADGQDDNHYAAYVTSVGSGAPIGVRDGSVRSYAILFPGSFMRAWNNNDFYLQTSYAPSTGLVGTTRSSPTAFSGMAGGEVESAAFASTGTTAYNASIFGRNTAGSIADYSSARLAFYSIGSSISLSSLDNRVSALVSAVSTALS